jgi:hypothetical protein
MSRGPSFARITLVHCYSNNDLAGYRRAPAALSLGRMSLIGNQRLCSFAAFWAAEQTSRPGLLFGLKLAFIFRLFDCIPDAVPRNRTFGIN